MNVPNALTISRLAAIPILMALLLMRFPGHDQLAALLFIVFSFTDTLDGELARRSRRVSDLGKFLDPLADKLFVLAVLIVLVQEGLVAAWVVVVIFSRELIITILRSVAASQGRVIAAAPLGKTKTVTQMSAVTLLILQRPYHVLVPLADIAVVVAVVFTLWSGLDYLWRFRHLIAPFDASRTRAAVGGGAPEASIAYSNEVKRDQLGVAPSLFDSVGAISREVGEAMALGVRSRLGTSLGVGVTGIAGPDADGTSKPVGLTYIAVASDGHVASREFKFDGDRASIRRQAAAESLRMLIAEVQSLRRPSP